MRGLALLSAEGGGVVGVSRSGRVASGEGGAAVAAYPRLVIGRGIERVGDGERAAVVAHEACAVGGAVGGEHTAGKGAALDGGGDAVGRAADESGVSAVTADGAVDGDATQAVAEGGVALCAADESGGVLVVGADGYAAGAVLDGERAPEGSDDAARVVLGGGDGAGNVKVADGCGAVGLVVGVGLGGADVAERGGVVAAVAADIDGQRVAVAVEGAAEVVLAAARHARDGILRRADVVAELHGLAAEAVVGVVVVEAVAEDVPARGGVDGVRAVAVDGEVGGVGGAGQRHGGMFRPHSDGACDVGLAIGRRDCFAVHGKYVVVWHVDIDLGIFRTVPRKAICRNAGQAVREGDIFVEALECFWHGSKSGAGTHINRCMSKIKRIIPNAGEPAAAGKG